jgi:hypothetical protein
MKRYFVFGILIVALMGSILSMMPPDTSWAGVSYYLSQWGSTTTKLFNISGKDDPDTTAAFTPMKYGTFFVHATQPNDSVFFWYVTQIAQRNYADSTFAWTSVDSALVIGTGFHKLNFRHFFSGGDSCMAQLPAASWARGLMYASTSGNGKATRINVYYEGRKEGEY